MILRGYQTFRSQAGRGQWRGDSVWESKAEISLDPESRPGWVILRPVPGLASLLVSADYLMRLTVTLAQVE